MQSVETADRAGLNARQSVLEIDDLKTWFHTDAGIVKAVNGVTLSVAHGETLAIVGESGSGKSVTGLTVMRLLGRRTTGRIEGGQIRFRGRDGCLIDLAAASDAEMARIRGRDIAMIFQDPMSSLNPVFPIGDQIAEPIRIHRKADRHSSRALAIDLLRDVGITDPERRIDAFPHQLSGGMRQRVMIAIALACDPMLLIADEPTTALDVTIQAQIIALLKRLQRERGMALIFVTHDLKVVEEIADHVAVMYASQIVEQGPAAQLLVNPRHPYTRALLACTPHGAGYRTRLVPIPGALPNPLKPPAGCRFHPRCGFAVRDCGIVEPTLEAVGMDHASRCFRWREARVLTPAISRPHSGQDHDRPLLSVTNLTKHFDASPAVRAVEDVTFTLDKGEVLGVVGESGSGKSTIGRLVLRLLEPTAGTVTFADENLGALAPQALRRFRRHMQMIFQDPFASLNPRMTIGEALVEPIRLHLGLDKTAALEAAGELLERVGLTREHLRRYPKAFSGGQRQRVAIARALASNPDFIVADEPVSALDVSIQAEVLNLLQDLQRDLSLTLMFISHDLSVVEVVADRVMVLYLGRVMELAPSEALFKQPAHPYSAALMHAAPGARPNRQRIVLSGEIPSPSAPPSGCVFRTRCPFVLPHCADTVPPLRETAPGHWKACIRDDLAL